MSKKLALSSALSVLMMASFAVLSPSASGENADSAARSLLPAKAQLGGFALPSGLPFNH